MRKFLLFGLMLVLMAVPVMAEQSWDSNATQYFPATIYGAGSLINENYTFKFSLNGSLLNLESDCSDLFIVYQDTTEVDRVVEGDCQTAEKDGLNVSWQMRPGATIAYNGFSSDWSVWTDGIGGIVPSDNKFLTYPFFDDFATTNTSKWDYQNAVVSGGAMDCKGMWTSTPSTEFTMSGNWTMKGELWAGSSPHNAPMYALCPINSIGVAGSVCNTGGGTDGLVMSIAGGYSINNANKTNFQSKTTMISPDTVPSLFDSYENTTLTMFQNGRNVSASRVGYEGGTTFYNDSNSFTSDYKFSCVQSDGDLGGAKLREIALFGAVEHPPTFDLDVVETVVISQLSPQEGSTQNGVDTLFNCSVTTLSLIGTNVSNVTVNVYDTIDALDYSEFFDYGGLVNNSYSSFNLNLTTDGIWDWSCSTTTDTNAHYSSDNKSFTVDTGIPTITLTAPIIESNISNIFSIYSVLDATSISCDYSINAGANTSIACTNDGVETITELDLSAIINYGVLNQFYFYANDSLANNNSKVINFTVVERIDEQWMETGLETESQQFNITLDDSLGIISGATLRYDNLNYVGALIETSGIQKTYGTAVNQPAVGSGTETRYFNWSIDGTVSNKAGSTTYPTHSSTVGNIEIAPTTDGSTCDSVDATLYALNFTFKNESTGALVEGANLIAWYEVWTTTSSAKLNFTWTESHAGQSSYPVCIFPDYGELNANIKLIYGNESEYEYREFNLQNLELNNQTQNYTLYQAELGSTTTITITVQDDVGRVLENYLVKAILYEYGNTTNPIREVDSHITDPDGIVILELGASDYYSFEVWKDGTLVHTRPSALLTQSEFTIVVSTQELYDATIFIELSNGITTTVTYSNITGNITSTWNDAGALGDSYCLNVYDHSSGDNSPFNSQCDTANNGQLIYHIGNSTEATGKWLARLDVRAVENSVYYTLDELWIDNEENWRTFGTEGLMWGGIIATTTLALLGAPAPAAVIAGTTLTLVVLGNMAEFFSFGWGVMALFILIAGVFIYFMRD